MELVKIDKENKVNARDLHEFLEIGTHYKDWFPRMCEYGFVEGKDFCSKMSETSNGGRPSIYHMITIEMAKEISMIQRNEKGKQARQYFIECEKKLKNNMPQLPQTFSEALQLAADQAKKIEEQGNKLLEQQPKVDFFNAVSDSKDAIEIGNVAKMLGIKGIGRNKLFEFLRDNKVLMNNNKPYQKYVDAGYFRVIEQKYDKPNGDTCINVKTLAYQKGIDYIRKLLNKE